jgi:hypothetical protein
MQKGSGTLPEKLRAVRVQRHVKAVLRIAKRLPVGDGFVRRDAARSAGFSSISWETWDLYTMAVDLAEDEELRLLVSQARQTVLGELTR